MLAQSSVPLNQLEESFKTSKGEVKETVARKILNGYGRDGVQFLVGELNSPSSENDIESTEETLYILAKVLGEASQEFVTEALKALEETERVFSDADKLRLDPDFLSRFEDRVFVSKILLQNTAQPPMRLQFKN